MNIFIKQKIKRVSYFLVTIGGGAFLFLALSSFEAHHEFIKEGGLAQVSGAIDPNNPISDFEGVSGSPDANNPIRDFEGLFGGPDANNPIRDFEGISGSQGGGFEPDFSFDRAIETVGGQRLSFGSEGFIPNDPRFDTTVRIISGTEGVIPGITESLSDLGNFGAEGFIPGDPRFPTEIGTLGTPNADVISGVGGAINKALGDIGGTVNDVLKGVGLPNIDFGFAKDILGGDIGGAIGELGIGGFAGDVLGIGDLGGGLSGIVSGDVGGILGGVLGGGGGISGTLGGALGGIFGGGGGGSFVPVKDFAQISLQQQQTIKEYNLDPVAYLASKTTIRGILGNVLNWINTGDNGNPYYVTNTADHFRNIDRNTVNVFLGEIQRLGLNPNIQRSLALSASPQFAQTIQPTISIGARDAFLQNFNNGGWEMWLQMLQPQNNPLGQYRLAAEELTQRRTEAELRESQELAWGSGFKPATVCIAKDFAGNCIHSEIVTPGTFIEGQMAGVFSSVIRQLEADDELGEITNSLLSNMMAQILGGGRVTGLRGFSPAAISSPQSDLEAVLRTKEGLFEAIGVLLNNEIAYYMARSSSVIRLQEGRKSLSSLLADREYFNVNEPLKSRLTSNTDLSSLIEANRAYATTTIQTVIDPAIAALPPDIALSAQLIGRIQTLAQELSPVNTAQGLQLISEKYVDLARKVHTISNIEQAQQEFETISSSVSGIIQSVNGRLSQEQALVEKIKNELFPSNTNTN